jgi:hypothetical protein
MGKELMNVLTYPILTNLLLIMKISYGKVPFHAMKAYTVGRVTGLLICNLGARWRKTVNITPQTIYPHERTPVPLNRRLGMPHSQSEQSEEETNLLPLPGIKPCIILPVA